ncbi:MAG: hypothetical protein H8D32_01595 [Dehalococcoidia bacterium]|nr:hypothetical protein [Dehalococcoidia bacterium]
MRLIRGCITVVGIIGILVIIALIMGYYLYSLRPWIQAKMTPVAVTAEAAQSFDQKFEALEMEIHQAIAAGEERETALVITEKEVNSKLVEVLAEGDLPFDQILVNFREGRFLIYAVADVPGVAARTGAIGRIQVVNGDLEIVLEDFDLGKLPLPQAVNGGIEKLLDIMVKLKLADVPLEITDVEISDRELTVSGLIKSAD